MARRSQRVRASIFVAAAAVVCLFGLAACGDSTVTGTAAGTVTAGPTTASGTATVAAIDLTDEGFAPDTVEVSQGTRLTLRNATDASQSVVVKGRDFGGRDGDSITIKPGETVDLNVYQLGAYVLTLADDPQVTASIFIS